MSKRTKGCVFVNRSMMEVAAERVGLRKAYRAGVFVATWAICSRSLGRPPETVDEFAEWACISRAQAFRDQNNYREAWPEFPSPTELLGHLDVQAEADRSEASIGRVLSARFVA